MRKTIISDTSCLILLQNIGQLDILKVLFGQIVITSTIAAEFGDHLPPWIIIQDPINRTYENILLTSVDRGEASAIALAVEQIDCLLIIDDHKARRVALQLGIKYTGTLGILVDAKLSGHIASIKPLLEKIKKTNFRLSSDLEKKILQKSGED